MFYVLYLLQTATRLFHCQLYNNRNFQTKMDTTLNLDAIVAFLNGLDVSLPVNPLKWPEIFAFEPAPGVRVYFFRTEHGYRMRVCVDDFEPIDFKPFQLKNIASVTACFLIPSSNPKVYTLSVSRPGDFPELIKLTVASPGDFHETSSPAAPTKPNSRNKGSTSGGHRRRNRTAGPSTTTN